jgi:hypothetical protein
MTRIIAKLFAIAVALTAFLPVAPLFAANIVAWISSTGSDSNPCTAALPCATFFQAINSIGAGLNGQVNCLPSVGTAGSNLFFSVSVTIDCAGVYEASTPNEGALVPGGTNQVVKIRNLTISGSTGGWPAMKFIGSGTLIIENCAFENMSGIALDIEPNGPLNLVIKNSRVSNNAAGVLLKPAAGGSVTASFNGITITNNSGGGLRADSSNGPITVDISDSVIAENVSNGLNITSGTGTQNDMVNIIRTTIAKNGLVGIQAGGSNAAVLLNASTLDSNTNGATLSSNGGRIISYGNNQLIGAPGSGFTGSLSLQ